MAASALPKALAIAAIAALGTIGVYGVFYIGSINGLFNSIAVGVERGRFPGCPDPFKATYTGVEPVDQLLVNLVPFFCFMIDGEQNWADKITNWYLTAQWIPAWTLLSLEAIRRGNRGRPTSWMSLVGCIWQVVSYTLTAPLYLIMHLLSSPVASASTAAGADAIIADAAEIDLVPTSVVLGLIVPTMLMGLPTPDVVSAATHYNFIALWQIFPLLHSIAFYTLRFVLPSSGHPAGTREKAHLKSVASVYKFALSFAIASQLAGLAVALTPAALVPSQWAAPFEQVSVWTLLPPFSFSTYPSVTAAGETLRDALAPLTMHFLKFDIYGGNTALLVWSFFLYVGSGPSATVLSALLKTVVWTVVGGPIAAAAVLLWARDEVVLSQPRSVKRK